MDQEALMPGTRSPRCSRQITIIPQDQSVSVTKKWRGGKNMLLSELQREHDCVEYGNLRDSQGRYDEALAAYDSALRIDPDDADALFDKGETLEKMGNLLEAKKFYDRAMALYNGYWDSHSFF